MRIDMSKVASAVRAFGDFSPDSGVVFSGVRIDSRVVRPGDLFACIAGGRFDGHNFAREAVQRGAAAVLAHQPVPEITSVPVLQVRDTLKALADLAAYWREQTRARVIGITGSAGKTTSKELLYAVLSEHGKAVRSYKNFNNQLGLPLSILSFAGDEQYWIVEAGINHPLDMEYLGRILRPDVAVLINIGPCHLQGLKDEQGVAEAKARLLDFMPPAGICIAGYQYPELTREIARRKSVRTFWFGSEGENLFCRTCYQGEKQGRGRYRVRVGDKEREFLLPLLGGHVGESVAAAFCTAAALGVRLEQMQADLPGFVPPGQRMQRTRVADWIVLDDSYNANPVSMRGAIRAAAEMHAQGDLVLVLGEMAELGEEHVRLHRQLGEWISRVPFKATFLIGEGCAAVLAGVDPARSGDCYPVNNPGEFMDILEGLQVRSGVILFKGSRKAQLENYAHRFKDAGCKNGFCPRRGQISEDIR